MNNGNSDSLPNIFRMEINSQDRHEHNTMVIGPGHMVLVFVMLFGSLILSLTTLLGEYVTRRVLNYASGRSNKQPPQYVVTED